MFRKYVLRNNKYRYETIMIIYIVQYIDVYDYYYNNVP